VGKLFLDQFQTEPDNNEIVLERIENRTGVRPSKTGERALRGHLLG